VNTSPARVLTRCVNVLTQALWIACPVASRQQGLALGPAVWEPSMHSLCCRTRRTRRRHRTLRDTPVLRGPFAGFPPPVGSRVSSYRDRVRGGMQYRVRDARAARSQSDASVVAWPVWVVGHVRSAVWVRACVWVRVADCVCPTYCPTFSLFSSFDLSSVRRTWWRHGKGIIAALCSLLGVGHTIRTVSPMTNQRSVPPAP
jgi:hypothetical protein